MEQPNHNPRNRFDLMRDAALTLGAVLLAFAALDDITTDTATSFVFERLALALCCAWLLFVAWRLIRIGHRAIGAISALAVAAGVAAQPALGPATGPGFRVEYLAMIGVLIWFIAVAGMLATSAWRLPKTHAA